MKFECAWCGAALDGDPGMSIGAYSLCEMCTGSTGALKHIMNLITKTTGAGNMRGRAWNAIEGFTFGCDPEAVIVDKDGKPVSAEGIIPGTKAEPYKVPGGAVQRDGLAAEFNIDPVTNFEDFDKNITQVVKALKGFLPKGCDLSFIPAAEFSEEIFAVASDDAKELGCTPDFNAWTGDINPPPCLEATPRLRCFGGHVHIGWTEDVCPNNTQHLMNCRDLVRQLDWFLGGWSVKMDPDVTRRRLYGKAGAYRPKPYGAEYRVLSNFWVTAKDRRLTMWNRMQQAIYEMRQRYMPEKVDPSRNEQLIAYINDGAAEADFTKTFHYPLTTTDALYAKF